MADIKAFKDIVGDCSKESLWTLVEMSLDKEVNAKVGRDVLSDPDYFNNEFVEQISSSDIKSRVYLLQWLNMSLCSLSLPLDSIAYILLQNPKFQNMLYQSLVNDYNEQLYKFYLILCFNYLKQQLEIDPNFINTHNLFSLATNHRNFIHYTLPVYFHNYETSDHDGDVHYEWISRLYNLMIDHIDPGISLLQWLLTNTDLKHHNTIYDFYIIHIDERIRSKNSYSLVLDIPANLLDTDEDFSNRIDKENTITTFSIRESDVKFMLTTFYIAADTVNLIETLDAAHSIIKMLIGITFIGRYNTALQDLILDDNKFLGKLSEMLKTICLAKVRKDDRYRRPELCSNIIRLASNLVHANNTAQDFLLKTHYLPFYLSQTNREQDELYAKEVTVVFVRYMTESNHAAREYIKQLKVDDFIAENANFVKKFDDI